MSSNIIEAALKERERIINELKVANQQLSALDALIASYGAKSAPQSSPASEPRQRTSTRTNKSEQITAYAKEAIIANGGNAKMTVIKEYLESKNIYMRGNTLSAYLSLAPEFVADRSKGWGLAPAQMNTAPVVAGAVDVVSSEQHPIQPQQEKGGGSDLF